MEEKDAGVLMRKSTGSGSIIAVTKALNLRERKIRQLHIQSCAADTAGSRMDPGWKIRIFAAQFLSFMQGILHRVCLQYDASKGDRRL